MRDEVKARLFGKQQIVDRGRVPAPDRVDRREPTLNYAVQLRITLPKCESHGRAQDQAMSLRERLAEVIRNANGEFELVEEELYEY